MDTFDKIALSIVIEGSQDAIRDISAIDQSLVNVRKDIKGLKEESGGTAAELKKITTELKGLENEGKNTGEAYDQLTADAARLDKQLKDNAQAAGALAIEERKLREEKKLLNKEINQSVKDFAKFEQAIPDDSIEGLARSYSTMRKELRLVPKQIRELGQNFENNEKALKKLEPATEDAVRAYIKLKNEARDTKQDIIDFDQGINDFTSNIGNYASALDGFNLGGIIGKIGQGALGFASGGVGGGLSALGLPPLDAVGKFASALGPGGILATAIIGTATIATNYAISVTREYEKLFNSVSRITGEVGADLQDTTARIKTISEVFDQDFERVLQAANATQKGFGEDFKTTLTEIESGLFQLGSSEAQDEFLDSLREYPQLIDNAGFSLQEFIQLNVIAAQAGTFSDKLVDSVKEAGLALTEFTQTQRDAVAGVLGDDFADDFEKRIREGTTTSRDAILELGQQLEDNGADLQDYATITADVFKGAGEDVGGFADVYELVKESIIQANEDIELSTNAYTERLIEQRDATLDLNLEQAELAAQLAGVGFNFDTLKTQAKSFGTSLLNDVLLNFRALRKEFENGNFLEGVGNFLGNSFELLIPDSVEEFFGLAEEGAGGRKSGQGTINEILEEDQKKLQEINEGLEQERIEDEKNQQKAIDAKRAAAAQTRAINKAIREDEARNKKAIDDRQKAEDQALKERESAADNIEKLERKISDERAKSLDLDLTNLDEYNRQVQNLRNDFAGEVFNLVGTPEQIQEQTQQLSEQLDIRIDVLNQKRQKAIDDQAKADAAAASRTANSALNSTRSEQENDAINNFNQLFDGGNQLSNEERIAAEKELYDELLRIEVEYLESKKLLIEGDETLNDEQKLQALQQIAEREAQINRDKNDKLIADDERAAQERIAIQERTANITADAIEGVGNAIAGFLNDQDKDVKEFYKSLILTAIKALESFLVASVTAQALAQPDSVATFGLTGAARAALLSGLVKAAFTVARAAIGQFDSGGLTGNLSVDQAKQNYLGYVNYYNTGGVAFPSKTGGMIKGPQHKDGGVKFRMLQSGRAFIGEAHGDELILNPSQIRKAMSIYGNDMWSRLGVPGSERISGAIQKYYSSNNVKHGNIYQYDQGGFTPQVIGNSEFRRIASNNDGGMSENDMIRQAQIIGEIVGGVQSNVLLESNNQMAKNLEIALDENRRYKERYESSRDAATV